MDTIIENIVNYLLDTLNSFFLKLPTISKLPEIFMPDESLYFFKTYKQVYRSIYGIIVGFFSFLYFLKFFCFRIYKFIKLILVIIFKMIGFGVALIPAAGPLIMLGIDSVGYTITEIVLPLITLSILMYYIINILKNSIIPLLSGIVIATGIKLAICLITLFIILISPPIQTAFLRVIKFGIAKCKAGIILCLRRLIRLPEIFTMKKEKLMKGGGSNESFHIQFLTLFFSIILIIALITKIYELYIEKELEEENKNKND